MCFSLAWLQAVMIWALVVGGIVAVLYILATYVLSKLPGEIAEAAGVLSRIIKVVIWVFVAIFVVYIGFMLISCLLSMAGGLPSLHR